VLPPIENINVAAMDSKPVRAHDDYLCVLTCSMVRCNFVWDAGNAGHIPKGTSSEAEPSCTEARPQPEMQRECRRSRGDRC